MELREKIKLLLLMKKDGRVDKGATLLFYMMIMFIMVITSLNAFKDMENKNNIGHVGRNYMLRIESNGYLSKSDEFNMVRELESLGVTDINTIGTTKSKVGYGNECLLNISGKYKMTVVEFMDHFNVKESTQIVDVLINKKSTSKD